MKYSTLRNPNLAGWAAALLMVLIGSGWQLATRAGARSQLAPVDLALLRDAIPALLLAPVWWRCGLLPPTASRARVALIVIGAGLPFGLLAMAGAHFAPVAHMGVLLPGASPLLVTLAAWGWLGSRPRRMQVAGLCLLGAGLAAVSLPSWASAQGSGWVGDLLFLAAALLWAVYTLALRESGLGPWQSAALVSAWSALAVIPLWTLAFASGMSLMPVAATGAILTQVVWQGLVAGVAGLAVFGFAVKQIGAAATSSVGALVPAVVAAGGWLLLNEAIEPTGWVGVLAVVGGVALATRSASPPTTAPMPLQSPRTAR
jgi:drug/metabolite transporter (DMT)-like permease